LRHAADSKFFRSGPLARQRPAVNFTTIQAPSRFYELIRCSAEEERETSDGIARGNASDAEGRDCLQKPEFTRGFSSIDLQKVERLIGLPALVEASEQPSPSSIT
jgi:hypothetical protein